MTDHPVELPGAKRRRALLTEDITQAGTNGVWFSLAEGEPFIAPMRLTVLEWDPIRQSIRVRSPETPE